MSEIPKEIDDLLKELTKHFDEVPRVEGIRKAVNKELDQRKEYAQKLSDKFSELHGAPADIIVSVIGSYGIKLDWITLYELYGILQGDKK